MIIVNIEQSLILVTCVGWAIALKYLFQRQIRDFRYWVSSGFKSETDLMREQLELLKAQENCIHNFIELDPSIPPFDPESVCELCGLDKDDYDAQVLFNTTTLKWRDEDTLDDSYDPPPSFPVHSVSLRELTAHELKRDDDGDY